MTKQIVLYLKLTLLLIIIFWIVKSVNLSETLRVLTKANLLYFFLAFTLNNLSNVIVTIKWHRLATPLRIKSNYYDLLKLNYIAVFYSIFLPGQGTGELIKGLKLTKKEHSHQNVWVPIFIDKVTNVLIVCLIGFVAILLDKTFSQNKSLVLIVSLLTAFLFVLTIILFSEHTTRFINLSKSCLIKFLRPLKINTKVIEDFSVSYFEDYKKHNLLMIETLLWSVLIKLPHVFAYLFFASSLNIHLDLIQCAWLYAIVSTLSLLPISFSGLGIREGSMIVLLSQIGIHSSSALSLSMLVFLSGILIGLIGGLLEFLSIVESRNK